MMYRHLPDYLQKNIIGPIPHLQVELPKESPFQSIKGLLKKIVNEKEVLFAKPGLEKKEELICSMEDASFSNYFSLRGIVISTPPPEPIIVAYIDKTGKRQEERLMCKTFHPDYLDISSLRNEMKDPDDGVIEVIDFKPMEGINLRKRPLLYQIFDSQENQISLSLLEDNVKDNILKKIERSSVLFNISQIVPPLKNSMNHESLINALSVVIKDEEDTSIHGLANSYIIENLAKRIGGYERATFDIQILGKSEFTVETEGFFDYIPPKNRPDYMFILDIKKLWEIYNIEDAYNFIEIRLSSPNKAEAMKKFLQRKLDKDFQKEFLGEKIKINTWLDMNNETVKKIASKTEKYLRLILFCSLLLVLVVTLGSVNLLKLYAKDYERLMKFFGGIGSNEGIKIVFCRVFPVVAFILFPFDLLLLHFVNKKLFVENIHDFIGFDFWVYLLSILGLGLMFLLCWFANHISQKLLKSSQPSGLIKTGGKV
ncbi:hypothetical protein CMO94_01780 [Candidatus Woesearchaeota archaeon]|nr:hypothetical protein [Candidatus Woesearchaeota archaeon]